MNKRCCFICLQDNHLSTECPDRAKCSKCNAGMHHISMCKSTSKKASSGGSAAATETSKKASNTVALNKSSGNP